MFSNNDAGRIFIKEGTHITNAQEIYLGFLKPTTQGILYVKAKTVFHAGTFSTSKVVYISNFKELAKNQKVVPSFREEKHLSKVRNTTIKTGTPFSRLPFRGGYFGFYYQYWAFLMGQVLPNKKNDPSFIKKAIYNKNIAGNTFFSGRFKRWLNYANTIKINRNLFLRNCYGRPPPVA